MNEKQMTRGTDYDGENVIGWLMSEKLDGVRGYWDGAQLWTRGGNVIAAPAWFTATLPKGQALDGEIWFGRGQFTRARVAVQHGKNWEGAMFRAFDAPGAAGTWAERMATVPAELAVDFTPVASFKHLIVNFNIITGGGGEGLMLRHPTATGYEQARTSKLLKLKSLEHVM